ncbi:hypothetical protein E2C01_017922 [Portunus trituberculatus]|uniref:Uncharacterized protein n=1 Tax=Portunus trituberculatus TaxID=210409 RepID=A0A5B7DTR7_PORTR|nr:hypothetical protein [Portunus trituberculatus]
MAGMEVVKLCAVARNNRIYDILKVSDTSIAKLGQRHNHSLVKIFRNEHFDQQRWRWDVSCSSRI